MSEKINCTAPDCRRALSAAEMWLPEWKARQNANGGKRVLLADFPKYALCGRCGHLLRKEGEKVYRYTDEVAYEEKAEGTRKAKEMTFKPFAERFKPQSKGEKDPSPKPTGDGRHVGQGLSKLSREDADKRQNREAKEAPKPNGATAPSPTSDAS